MKKIISTLMLGIMITIIGCTEQPAKKEVIVVPGTNVIIDKTPPSKSTTITLDKNGVKVEAKKIDMTIKNQ